MNPVDWAFTRDLPTTQAHLLVALAWLADDQGVTFKGQKTIAERIAKDPRWVRKGLADLGAGGLLTRYRRHRLDGSRTTDLIVLNLPREAPVDLGAYSGLVGAKEPDDHEPSGGNPPGGLPAGNDTPSGGFQQASGGKPPGVINLSSNPSIEPRGQAASSPVERVFAKWAESIGKPKSVLDLKRRRLIGNALKVFPEPDLLDAVQGWRHSPHHRGENQQRQTYNDIELLLRDAKHVEMFRDLHRGSGGPASAFAGIRL